MFRSLWAALLPLPDKGLVCFKLLPKRWGKGKETMWIGKLSEQNVDKPSGGVSLGIKESKKTPGKQEHICPSSGCVVHIRKDANVPTVALLIRVWILDVHGSKA